MELSEALKFMRFNPGIYLKMDWWSDYMAIKYDDKKKIFVSGPGVPINICFLLPGNYVLSSYNEDVALGGLFAL